MVAALPCRHCWRGCNTAIQINSSLYLTSNMTRTCGHYDSPVGKMSGILLGSTREGSWVYVTLAVLFPAGVEREDATEYDKNNH